MKNTDNKYRYEFKYLISTLQMYVIKSKLNKIMFLDNNICNDNYSVRSIYFDNYDNRCYFENDNSEGPRRKYRLRIYNFSDNIINLEIKHKEHGKVLKYRSNITKEQTNKFLNGNYIKDCINNNTINEFNSKIMSELYHPVVIVDYERIPYIYKYGNVRVTIDSNITASDCIKNFFDKNIRKRPILSFGAHILEVKFDDYLPDIIFNTLQIQNLKLVTFSKYYLCRKYNMIGRNHGI